MSGQPHVVSSPEAAENARICIQLQDMMTKVEESNIEATQNAILNSIFATNKNLVAILVETIFVSAKYHPPKIYLYAQMVAFFIKNANPDNSLSLLKPHFLRYITRSPDNDSRFQDKLPLFFFLASAFKYGAIPFSDISTHICRWLNEKTLSPNQLFILYFLFLPQLDSMEGDFAEQIRRIVSVKKSDGRIHQLLLPLYPMIQDLRADNYKLHGEIISYGCLQNSLEYILKFDHEDALKQYISIKKATSAGFDPNMIIPVFPLEPSLFLHSGPTILQYAAFHGAIKCFKLLLENGAQINKLGSVSKHHTIHYAIDGQNIEIFKLVRERDDYTDACLRVCAQFKNDAVFDYLYPIIEKTPEFPHEIKRVMKQCAKSNNFKVLQFCLEKGHDHDITYRNGHKLGHFAAEMGNTGILYFLYIFNAIDINCPAQWGMTPLHLGAKLGYNSIVNFLLSLDGISVNARTNSGWTPLHLSAMKGHMGISTALLNFEGIEKEPRDSEGNTPLHYAAQEGYCDITSLLIKKNVNVNVQNSKGHTPLHLAALKNQGEIVAFLLNQEKVDINVRNEEGLTAFDLGNEATRQLFLNKYPDMKPTEKKTYIKKKCRIC